MQAAPGPEEAHAPAATGEGTEAAGHESGGLPQFDTVWWPGQIAWLLLIFAVLYVVLAKVLLPKVGGAIETRNEKIAGDLAKARALKAEAEAQSAAAAAEMAEARAKAHRTAAEAKAKAAAEAASREAAEQAVIYKRTAEAEAQIRAAREAAMANVRTIAIETAQAITAKLTGKPASTQEVEDALTGLSA